MYFEFTEKELQEVVKAAVGEALKAKWTTAYINNLPDSSFAFIEDGGELDDDKKTTPRSLRHLPYKDVDGKVDLPHLRNALARLDQTDLSDDIKKKVGAKLRKVAADEGIGEEATTTKKQVVFRASFKADASDKVKGWAMYELARPINPLDDSASLEEMLIRAKEGKVKLSKKGIDTDGEFQMQKDVYDLGARIVQGKQAIDVQHDKVARKGIRIKDVFVNDEFVKSPNWFPGALVIGIDLNGDPDVREKVFNGQLKSLSFHCYTAAQEVTIAEEWFE